MIMDAHDVEGMTTESFRCPECGNIIPLIEGSYLHTCPEYGRIELETDPPAYEVAEVARQKLQTLRQQILWDSQSSVQFYLDKLGQAVEQLLGQYHQDNKPKG